MKTVALTAEDINESFFSRAGTLVGIDYDRLVGSGGRECGSAVLSFCVFFPFTVLAPPPRWGELAVEVS